MEDAIPAKKRRIDPAATEDGTNASSGDSVVAMLQGIVQTMSQMRRDIEGIKSDIKEIKGINSTQPEVCFAY